MEAINALKVTLAAPSNDGGKYFPSLSVKIQARDGEKGTKYIPLVPSQEAERTME